MTIIEKLSEMYEKKKQVSASIATALACALIALPVYFINSKFCDVRNRGLPKLVVNSLVDRCEDEKDIKRVLVPHLVENPDLVDKIEDSAGKMLRLSWILSKEPEKSEQLEQRVSVSGNSRVDIGTNSYFSQQPLSQNVQFYPELKMLFDIGSKVLYKVSDSTQRLVEPIREINDIVKAGNQYYLTQTENLFLVSSNKLTRVDGKEYNLKQILGTPFAATFAKDGFKVLGEPISKEERKLKKELEEQITRVGKINPADVNRISYNDRTVFIFNGKKLVSLNPRKPLVNEITAGDHTIFIDYAVTKEWNFREGKELDSNKGRTIVLHQLERKEHYIVSYNEINLKEYERVPADDVNNSNYRFPNNPSLTEISWVSPSYLKARVNAEIIKQKHGRKK